jgi:phosphoribosylamine--glycine ligase / phosphoribosylformylglycinamidine cyclo-ligase
MEIEPPPKVEHLYVVPENTGTSQLQKTSNVPDTKPNDHDGLVKPAKELGIGLVAPSLDDGVVDGDEVYFRATGIPCFGSTKEAAEIEDSNTFAKDFMQRHRIPTAEYHNFSS